MPEWTLRKPVGLAAHLSDAETLKAEGFRPRSLFFQAHPNKQVLVGDELWGGLWVKESGPDFYLVPFVSEDSLTDLLEEHEQNGFTPALVAVGGASYRWYHLMMEAAGPPRRMNPDLPVKLLGLASDLARVNQEHPRCIAAHGVSTDPTGGGDRCAVIWERAPRPDVHWAIHTTDNAWAPTLEQGMRDGFAYPHQVSVTEGTDPTTGPRYALLYMDDPLRRHYLLLGIEPDAVDGILEFLLEEDLWPVHVHIGSLLGATKYSMVIAQNGDFWRLPRTWTVRRPLPLGELPDLTDVSDQLSSPSPQDGASCLLSDHVAALRSRAREWKLLRPVSPPEPPKPGVDVSSAPEFSPLPPFSCFDREMKRIMRTYGVRGAQLSVTKGDRLVYCPGYTLAEEGYPITGPRQRMRIGSIAKTLTGLGVWRLIEESNGAIDVHSMLGPLMKWPDVPADDRFNKRTIEQFLTHTSGMDPDVLKAEAGLGRVAMELGVNIWDLEPGDLADYLGLKVEPVFLAQNAVPNEANPPAGTYLNENFYFLGQMLARQWLDDPARYAEAIAQLVFARLGLPVGRPAVTRNEAAGAFDDVEETRYHGSIPLFGGSAIAPGFPIRPLAYDTHNFALEVPAGSWAMAACDYARVMAAFTRPTNPIFVDPGTQAKVLTVTVQGTFRYFSRRTVPDADGQSVPIVWHNGVFLGSTALAFRRFDNDVSVVALFNCDIPGAGLSPDEWGRALNQCVNAIDAAGAWPEVDLWAEVGIAPWA